MKPSTAKEVIKAAILLGKKLLLVSPPGLGKTSLSNQASTEVDADLITIFTALEDPTTPKGLPWIAADHKSATFVPFGDLLRIYNMKDSKRRLVVLLEDLGQATAAVQASFMNLLQGKAPNGYVIPDNVTWLACTNRRQDKANVQGVLEPVKSRFDSIIHIEADLDDFCNYAIDTNQPPEGIAYLRFQPEMLHKFEASLDLVNSPCPRTWFAAFGFLGQGFSEDVEFELIKGAVGEGAAIQFCAFLRLYRTLPSLDGILIDPDHAEIPEEMNTLYAVSAGLAHKANPTNFKAISKYANRMLKANRGEFATLMVRDSCRRDKKIMSTPAFIALTSSELGQLIAG